MLRADATGDGAVEREAARIDGAVAAVRATSDIVPAWAIIAGSGLSGLADRLSDSVRLPYGDIPGWPAVGVAGHAGELALGRLDGTPVAVAAGRAHLYEGHPPRDLVFGLRALHALGARSLVVTNAAGGLDPSFEPGDVMILRDHLFLPGLVGQSPLGGPNDERLGPRFPGMVAAYDPALRAAAREALATEGLVGHEGVYVMVAGPSYETPAEARLLRTLGADAVGMSTAPEVVAARHMGMRVLGLSLITNRVAMRQDGVSEGDEGDAQTTDGAALHAEVTDVGARTAPRLARAIARVIARDA
jgi:purine-nucleoside phosphorylase